MAMNIQSGDKSIFWYGRLHSQFISQAQLASSTNVANISTPGYKSIRTPDFQTWVEDHAGTVRAQQTNATATGPGSRSGRALGRNEAIQLSGNTVSIEEEMQRAGEIRRMHNLNTSVLKSFHRMYLASVKA